METGKIQVINGAVGAGALIAAATADASAAAVMIIGIGGAITTTIIGAYTAWRAAKHRADEADAPLVQYRLRAIEDEKADLRKQVGEWRELYTAATRARTTDQTTASAPPANQSTPETSRPS
jgi:hypothetical protein